MTETTSPAGGEEATRAAGQAKGRRPVLRLFEVVALAAVAGLLALLIWRVATGERGASLVAAVKAGKQPAAPVFDLPVIWPHGETWPPRLRAALADERIKLTELRGYPVVINFWASWCIPCKAEAPRLTASARAHRGRVAFVGIDIQDFTSDARGFLRHYKTNYVSVRDGGNSTPDDYGLTGVPETFYVDRRGRVVAHSVGEVSRNELEQGISQAASK